MWFHPHYYSHLRVFWHSHHRRRILGKTIAGLTVATPFVALAQGAYLLYGTCFDMQECCRVVEAQKMETKTFFCSFCFVIFFPIDSPFSRLPNPSWTRPSSRELTRSDHSATR
jgi:hypothetical protein